MNSLAKFDIYESKQNLVKRNFKIIVVGDSSVGKTSLTYRFCEGRYPERTEATIGVDFREKTMNVSGEVIKLQLWDTAGQERFRKSMVQHYYRNVHAVVFVYDITRSSSFTSLSSWIAECDGHNLDHTQVVRILVGNKCDDVKEQQVPTQVAQRFADQHRMPLFETSAKDDSQADHVEAIFLTVALRLAAAKPFMPRSYGEELAAGLISSGESVKLEEIIDHNESCVC